ncbi:MAG: CoA transferase [Acetobacterales bacterium]
MTNSGTLLDSVDDLVARIPDGAMVALPPDYSLPAMEAVRSLIRRGARDLRLLGVPVSGLASDMLIGAGCVASIESSAVSLGEQGMAPRFTEAVRSGAITMRDATCPAVHTALQASEKGVPFMPLRGVLGSDLIAWRPDWKVVDNPFGDDDPILLVPAIRPDVALFHACWADRDGNVWIGRRRELATIAHAAATTLVTVEEVRDDILLDDEIMAAGTLSAVYVSAVARAGRGAWPLGVAGVYAPDQEHLAEYARLARTAEGFATYLDRFVRRQAAA